MHRTPFVTTPRRAARGFNGARGFSRAAAFAIATACSATTLLAQTPAADGWVVLPVDEYRALRDRAIPPPPAPPAPPMDATLTRIDYELRVDTDSISGRALLT